MLYILSLILPFTTFPCIGTVWCIFSGGRGHTFFFAFFTKIMRGRPVPAENDSRIACVENTEE